LAILSGVKSESEVKNAIDLLRDRSVSILFSSIVEDTISTQVKNPQEKKETLAFVKAKYNEEFIAKKLKGAVTPEQISANLESMKSDVVYDIVQMRLDDVLQDQVPNLETREKIAQKLKDAMPKERVAAIITEAEKTGKLEDGVNKVIQLAAATFMDGLSDELLTGEINKIGFKSTDSADLASLVKTEINKDRDFAALSSAIMAEDSEWQIGKFKDYTTINSMKRATPIIIDAKMKEMQHMMPKGSEKIQASLKSDILACYDKIEKELDEYYSAKQDPVQDQDVINRASSCVAEVQKNMTKSMVKLELTRTAGPLFDKESPIARQAFQIIDEKIDYCFKITGDNMDHKMTCAIYASLPASRLLLGDGLKQSEGLRNPAPGLQPLIEVYNSCTGNELISKIHKKVNLPEPTKLTSEDKIDEQILVLTNRHKEIDMVWLKTELEKCISNIVGVDPENPNSIISHIKNSILSKIMVNGVPIQKAYPGRIDKIANEIVSIFEVSPGKLYKLDADGIKVPQGEMPTITNVPELIKEVTAKISEVISHNPDVLLDQTEAMLPDLREFVKNNSDRDEVDGKKLIQFIASSPLMDTVTKSILAEQLRTELTKNLKKEGYPFSGLANTGPKNLVLGVDGKVIDRLTSKAMIDRIYESRMNKYRRDKREAAGKPTTIKQALQKMLIEPALEGKIDTDSELPAEVMKEIQEIMLLDEYDGGMTDTLLDDMIQMRLNKEFRKQSTKSLGGFSISLGGWADYAYDITPRVNDFNWQHLKRQPSGAQVILLFRKDLMPLMQKQNRSAKEEALVKKYEEEMRKLIEKAQDENHQ
jgi:hypothetical protein